MKPIYLNEYNYLTENGQTINEGMSISKIYSDNETKRQELRKELEKDIRLFARDLLSKLNAKFASIDGAWKYKFISGVGDMWIIVGFSPIVDENWSLQLTVHFNNGEVTVGNLAGAGGKTVLGQYARSHNLLGSLHDRIKVPDDTDGIANFIWTEYKKRGYDKKSWKNG